MKAPQKRKNGQVVQENMAYPPEGNGWPVPLADNGPEIRTGIVNGKSGESKNISGMATSQMQGSGHHTSEA